MTRSEILATAREYLGTRFHHCGRLKGVGVDCSGLILCVGHDLGALTGVNVTSYGRSHDGSLMVRLCRENLDEIDPAEAKPGDVLLFRIWKTPQHLGIASEIASGAGTFRGLIHSHEGAGKVVEHVLDPLWEERILSAYRYRGVTD